MGDCHFNYPFNANNKEERFCKYSFASWCPTCEKSSPRRRSKSETNDCRRRCKEMKSLSPKKYFSHEYENMDLDFEARDSMWFDRQDARIRANLCELPTSYITNNCQTPKLIADKTGELVNCLEKTVKTYEQTLKYANEIRNRNTAKFIPRKFELRQSHIDRDISYDTGTYFDKAFDNHGLEERYNTELGILREKLKVWKKDTCDNTETVEALIKPKSGTARIGSSSMAKCKSKVSVKIRSRISSAKSRKTNKAVVARTTASSDLADSESSASDESDSNLNGDEESESISESIPPSTFEPKTVQAIIGLDDSSGDNKLIWPVRASLFPNVPPYIRFSTHDAETAAKIPAGRRLFKWKMSTITPVVVRKTLTNSGFGLVRKSNQWLGTWGKHMKSPMFRTLKDMQKLNHFPGTFQLGRKDRLWKNFQRLINRYGYKEFGFIPLTFVLPQELKLLKQNWEYKSGYGNAKWIVKPPASARGVGINVINKWSQLPKKTALVVQRYISNPYLINGSKFDLRLYVLVTSFNPLRIYMYPDGLARFASAKYSDDVKDLKDRYVHLTNYSINKLSNQYTANEDANACQGHKWTIKKLLEYLNKQGVDTECLWKNLEQLVIKTMITAEPPITQLCEENMISLYNCYELFGVDVLLDERLKPWLLEVNISPSLHSASPLDEHVKGPMVKMLFDLAQFHFPPRLINYSRHIPQVYDPRLYTTNLTKKERDKHVQYLLCEERAEYLPNILDDLTGDDIRRLLQAEDELTVKGCFHRIFPTSQTHKYLNFMEARYYNRLFDAWETRYEIDRQAGIEVLRDFCTKKVHLKIGSQSSLSKNGPNMNQGDLVLNLQPSKEGQSRPLDEIMQKVSIATTNNTTNNNTSIAMNNPNTNNTTDNRNTNCT